MVPINYLIVVLLLLWLHLLGGILLLLWRMLLLHGVLGVHHKLLSKLILDLASYCTHNWILVVHLL